ncbi:hypothetical protein C8J56DRAFT_1042179 [Mycena floridula]|nr:hypothetical protein C8J56DRAFT_1042179 [Mycena floridula]
MRCLFRTRSSFPSASLSNLHLLECKPIPEFEISPKPIDPKVIPKPMAPKSEAETSPQNLFKPQHLLPPSKIPLEALQNLPKRPLCSGILRIKVDEDLIHFLDESDVVGDFGEARLGGTGRFEV